jgi:hypothetical protein
MTATEQRRVRYEAFDNPYAVVAAKAGMKILSGSL